MDNLDKLLEAIEHPEHFSDTELHELLSDTETRQLYELLCASKAESFLKDSTPDEAEIDRQWQLFKAKRRRKSFFSWISNRKIAAVIAVLIASCSIIVVGVSLSNKFLGNSEKQAEQTVAAQLAEEVAPAQNQTLNDTVIIFEDEKLDKILDVVAPYYNVKVHRQSPSSKEVRLFLKWESTTNIEKLIDNLNSSDRINLSLKQDTTTDY